MNTLDRKNFIAREAWDFDQDKGSGYRGCPDEQLYACLFYEYAKESSFWLQLIEEKLERTPDHYILHLHPPAVFLRLFPEFPSVHWLQIPAEKREVRIKNFAFNVKFRADPLKPESAKALINVHDNQLQDVVLKNRWLPGGRESSAFTTLPFTICWAYSNQEILHAFDQWLQQNRPAPERSKRGKTPFRPDVLRADLKALGGLRLLHQMNAEQAVSYTRTFHTDEDGGSQPLFSAPRSWYRAKRRAEQIIEEFNIEGLPIVDDTQFPDAVSYRLGQHLHPNLIFVCALHNRMMRGT